MHWQKIVNMREGGLNAARERFVIRRAEQWIQPDEAIAIPLQARHLTFKKFNIAPVPAVTNDQHDCAASQHASPPVKVEHLKRLADARAARPIVDEIAHVFQSQVQVTDLKRTRDPGESCAEDKSLHRLTQRGLHSINKVKQETRVAFHRTADIRDDNQGTRL